MLEREVMTIDVTKEERQRIETLAQQHGYATARDYLLALVAEDAAVDEVDEYFDADPESDFRQAWHEAMSNQIHPISTLWDDLDEA